jgi:hypothetical protein
MRRESVDAESGRGRCAKRCRARMQTRERETRCTKRVQREGGSQRQEEKKIALSESIGNTPSEAATAPSSPSGPHRSEPLRVLTSVIAEPLEPQLENRSWSGSLPGPSLNLKAVPGLSESQLVSFRVAVGCPRSGPAPPISTSSAFLSPAGPGAGGGRSGQTQSTRGERGRFRSMTL